MSERRRPPALPGGRAEPPPAPRSLPEPRSREGGERGAGKLPPRAAPRGAERGIPPPGHPACAPREEAASAGSLLGSGAPREYGAILLLFSTTILNGLPPARCRSDIPLTALGAGPRAVTRGGRR